MIDCAFNDLELQIIGAIVLAGGDRVVKGQRVFLQCPEEEANDSLLKLIVDKLAHSPVFLLAT